MDYEYDVFISYRNEADSADWVQNILYDRLEFLLKQALNKGEVRIFMDKKGIDSGDDWAKRIKRALVTSRCMIPVLIPDYFHREWCCREFAAMLYRQNELGYNTMKNPKGLIHPIYLFDGEKFPDYAKNIQAKIFNNYFYPSKSFHKTDEYNEFYKEMRGWVEDLADAIKNAPKWSDEWLTPKWLDEPYEQLKEQHAKLDKKPIL